MGVMNGTREFEDADGIRWRIVVITGGRTSDYLNARVHKPIAQFTCLSARRPRRYASLPDADPESLARLTPADLTELYRRATTH